MTVWKKIAVNFVGFEKSDYPFEVNNNNLLTDSHETRVSWLNQNIGDMGVSWNWKTHNNFYFKNEEDATSFALSWCGRD